MPASKFVMNQYAVNMADGQMNRNMGSPGFSSFGGGIGLNSPGMSGNLASFIGTFNAAGMNQNQNQMNSSGRDPNDKRASMSERNEHQDNSGLEKNEQ